MDEAETMEMFRKWSESVGAPESLITSLLTDTDWSFVIKLHALVEASLNNLLTEHFRNPSLADIFALGNQQSENRETGVC